MALLVAVVVLAGGHLKTFFAAVSVSRGGNTGSPAVGTATPSSAEAANRSEQISHQHGATGEGDDWVRTRTGWEREAKWFASSASYAPALHPAVVAALVSLVALWALVAFPADAAEATDDPDSPDTTFTQDS